MRRIKFITDFIARPVLYNIQLCNIFKVDYPQRFSVAEFARRTINYSRAGRRPGLAANLNYPPH